MAKIDLSAIDCCLVNSEISFNAADALRRHSFPHENTIYSSGYSFPDALPYPHWYYCLTLRRGSVTFSSSILLPSGFSHQFFMLDIRANCGIPSRVSA